MHISRFRFLLSLVALGLLYVAFAEMRVGGDAYDTHECKDEAGMPTDRDSPCVDATEAPDVVLLGSPETREQTSPYATNSSQSDPVASSTQGRLNARARAKGRPNLMASLQGKHEACVAIHPELGERHAELYAVWRLQESFALKQYEETGRYQSALRHERDLGLEVAKAHGMEANFDYCESFYEMLFDLTENYND
jgi:hypothetical protein